MAEDLTSVTTAVEVTDRRPRPAPADSGSSRAVFAIPANATLVSLLVCGFAAVFVYGRVAGYVYAEDSDWATEFGHHPWYHALSFWQILGKYFTISHGWYRPTGFYLIPYLLRLDYFQPSEQIVLDIATLVLASVMITLFFPRLRILTGVVASLTILLAPALYLVTYGVQADSFYIIFGLSFLWLADQLYHGDPTPRRRTLLWIGTILSFLLTITTKEIGCLVALLVIPFLLLRGPDELTIERVRRAVRFALPFLFMVLVYGIVFESQVKLNYLNALHYSTHPSLQRALNFINLLCWTLGFRSPRHAFSNWVPNWSAGEAVVQAVILAVVVLGLVLTRRRFRPWRIALVALSAFVTAVGIASVGGIPYHSYPIVVIYGFIVLVVLEAVADRLDQLPRRLRAVVAPGVATALVVLIFVILLQGHQTYGGVIADGPQSAYLSASTQLFDGSTLAPVREANDPLLVFQDCLGGLDDPLKFYARSPTGTQFIEHGAFSYATALRAMEHAYSAHRPVYVALCTGTDDPWYVLRQFEGARRGLVTVVQ